MRKGKEGNGREKTRPPPAKNKFLVTALAPSEHVGAATAVK